MTKKSEIGEIIDKVMVIIEQDNPTLKRLLTVGRKANKQHGDSVR